MRKYVLALALCDGCTPHFSGALVVDGKPFVVTGCRSGQASSFSGVDLTAEDGAKLRLVYDPTGQARAVLFGTNAIGVDLGPCGPFQIEQQSSKINQIYNLRGSATLSCTASGHSVSGQITFENCH